jgi:hypothetical protein
MVTYFLGILTPILILESLTSTTDLTAVDLFAPTAMEANTTLPSWIPTPGSKSSKSILDGPKLAPKDPTALLQLFSLSKKQFPLEIPPAGYQFTSSPQESWSAFLSAGANIPAPIQCTYTNPDPRETGVIPTPLGCYQYEWIWSRNFPTYNITDAQAKLRWGTKIGGVWTVNNDALVGINTYKAAETKILISVPAFAEYAVFVGTPVQSQTMDTIGTYTARSTNSNTGQLQALNSFTNNLMFGLELGLGLGVPIATIGIIAAVIIIIRLKKWPETETTINNSFMYFLTFVCYSDLIFRF